MLPMNTRWYCSCAATLLLTACPPCRAIRDGTPMGQKGDEIRSELSSIDYRHYRDLDDYLSRCERVRILIPSMESFYKGSDAELQRLIIKDSDEPHLLELADFYVYLNALDKAGLQLLGEEMNLASEMSRLPSTQRQSFFDQRIHPFEQKEDQLANYEVDMARKAKKRGMAIPPWLTKSVSDVK